MKRVKIRRLLAMGSMLMMLAPLALHAAEPEDIIKYRQNMMKAIGGHTGAAGAIIQGKGGSGRQSAGHRRELQGNGRRLQELSQGFPQERRLTDCLKTPENLTVRP